MRHVRQIGPTCGQACVAMLAGCDLELAAFACGWWGTGSPLMVERALRRFGLRLGRRVDLSPGQLPPARARGLLVLHDGDELHGVALAGDGLARDPALAKPVPLARYPEEMERRGLEVGSWWPVRRAG
jgi:hypothetical protein